jgi:hypothetical protein
MAKRDALGGTAAAAQVACPACAAGFDRTDPQRNESFAQRFVESVSDVAHAKGHVSVEAVTRIDVAETVDRDGLYARSTRGAPLLPQSEEAGVPVERFNRDAMPLRLEHFSGRILGITGEARLVRSSETGWRGAVLGNAFDLDRRNTETAQVPQLC